MTFPCTVYLQSGAFGTFEDITAHVLLDSTFRCAESLGGETACDFQLIDKPGNPAPTVTKLMDVKVTDASGTIFRGQVDRRVYHYPKRLNHVKVAVQCVGYERLMEGSPMAFEPPPEYPPGGDLGPAMEEFYRLAMASWYEGLRISIADMFTNYWVGPPLTFPDPLPLDFDVPVHKLGRTNIAAALALIANAQGTDTFLWIDNDLAFRWGPIPSSATLGVWRTQVADEASPGDGMARMMPAPSPFVFEAASWAPFGLSDEPDGVTTFAVESLEYSIDSGDIWKGAIVVGDTPDARLGVQDWTGAPYAPVQVVTAEGWSKHCLQMAADSAMVGHRDDLLVGTAVVDGHGGWRRGQWFDAPGLLPFPAVIRGVDTEVIGKDTLRYTLEFGDRPRHSRTHDAERDRAVIGEPAIPNLQPVANKVVVLLVNPYPPGDSTTGGTCVAQLYSPEMKPLATPNVEVEWTLWYNGADGTGAYEDRGIGSRAGPLFLATLKSKTGYDGRAFNNLYATATRAKELFYIAVRTLV